MVRFRWLALALLLPLYLPTAASQAAVGPTVFYFDSMPGGGIGEAPRLVLTPPEGDDQTANCAGAPGCPTDSPLVLSAASAPLAVPHKKQAGQVEAVAWVKSWNNGPSPATKMTFTAKVGDTTVATGSKTQDVLLGAIVEYRVQMDYTGGDLKAGDVVTLVTSIETEGCGCYNPFAYPRGVSADHPWSVALPVVPQAGPTGGAIQYFPLTDPVARIETEFLEPTTQTVQYNWTTEAAALELAVAATVANGTVSVKVTDGANATVLDSKFTASGNETESVPTVAAGAWKVLIQYTGFQGDLAVVIAPPDQGPGTTGTSSAPPTNGTGTSASESGTGSTSTTTSTGETSKGTPLPLALAVAAVALALAGRRRP